MKGAESQTVAILRELVAFDTTSHRSNLELIEFARSRLEASGARCLRFPSDDRRKANLFATIGPADRGGLMLSGHSDVVPADPADWQSDPFTVAWRDGRFYGRGTADMKGFIAAVLAAAPGFADADLPVPVHIALTYDEEVGCLGAPALIRAVRKHAIQPRFCVVGEPTGMRVAIGHKGARAYHAHFRGKAGHSSLAPFAVNAVEHAAALVDRLTRLGRRLAAEGPFDEGYDVPYTTVHTGVFHGGTQVNIVPARCDVDFEFRPLPEADADAIEADIRGWVEDEIAPSMGRDHKECGVSLERRYGYPGLDMDSADPMVDAFRALVQPSPAIRIAFGTEAGWFKNELAVPAIVCGPGHIGDAHRPDEFVSADQLELCDRFLAGIRDELKAGRLIPQTAR